MKNYSRTIKPGFMDYKNMSHEFRPYVMFTNADNYKTKIVNTDRLGFRKTYYKKKLLGLDEINKIKRQTNIIIGGSTAFSMGSTSDKTTMHSFLSSFGDPCVSLGVRGAQSHQELITFLKFKKFFFNIKNLIILSGVNDLVLCGTKDALFYKDFGGVIGSSDRAFSFLMQSNSFSREKWIIGKNNLYFYIHYFFNKFKSFRFLLSHIFSRFKKSKQQKKILSIPPQSFEKKLKKIKKMFENDMHTWSILGKQMGIKITYILQPTITWTKRKPTDYENTILDYEQKRIRKYFTHDFTKKSTYLKYRNSLKKTCKKNFIKFYDANDLILKSDKNKQFFIDLAHFTTYGHYFMAKLINKIIKKNKD